MSPHCRTRLSLDYSGRASIAPWTATTGTSVSASAVPNSPKTADLILKRYRPGANEKFQQHFDSVHEVANRYFVLLWYLNEVAEGGETVFPQLDVRIKARQGRLLAFPPYWMFQHAGLPPLSGDKYILSTYLLF